LRAGVERDPGGCRGAGLPADAARDHAGDTDGDQRKQKIAAKTPTRTAIDPLTGARAGMIFGEFADYWKQGRIIC